MLASNRELSCLVVIGSPEPQVQTNEVHDFFMFVMKGGNVVETQNFASLQERQDNRNYKHKRTRV